MLAYWLPRDNQIISWRGYSQYMYRVTDLKLYHWTKHVELWRRIEFFLPGTVAAAGWESVTKKKIWSKTTLTSHWTIIIQQLKYLQFEAGVRSEAATDTSFFLNRNKLNRRNFGLLLFEANIWINMSVDGVKTKSNTIQTQTEHEKKRTETRNGFVS